MKLHMPLKDCWLRIITLKMQSCSPGHVLIIGETFKKYLAGHYTQNCKEFQKTMLRLLHTTHKTAKNAVIFHTHYNFFFTTATIIFTVLYMSNDFLTDFFRKIFAVLCVVCEGLETGWLTDPMLSDMMPGMSNKIVCEFKNWQYLAWLVYKGKK